MKEMKTKEEILEYVEDIDLSLMLLEDTMKGEIGLAMTKCRGQLEDVREYCASQFRQEWIPVEERVPKCMDDVDVTIQFSTGELITKTDCYDSVMNNWQKYGSSVIAWKPRPQPYNPTKS